MDIRDTIQEKEYRQRQVNQLAREITQYIKDSSDLEELTAYLTDILLNGRSPFDIFSHIGSGSYKDCFVLNKDWVIKFVAGDNYSWEEMELCDAAQLKRVDALFLRTEYWGIPPIARQYEEYSDICLEPDYIELDENGFPVVNSYDPEDIYGYIGVQRMADEFSSDDINPHLRYEDTRQSLITSKGQPVDSSQRRKEYLQVSASWLQMVIDTYGDETYERFEDFCEQYNLYDLREVNLGVLPLNGDVVPVIIDFMYSNVV